jgi:hypothetical protein
MQNILGGRQNTHLRMTKLMRKVGLSEAMENFVWYWGLTPSLVLAKRALNHSTHSTSPSHGEF